MTPHRVLLVEDESRIAEFLVKGLQAEDWEVVAAEDGHVGLYLATAEPFDAAMLEIGLPRMHGLDVLRAIRAAHPSLPVVMFTARDEPIDAPGTAQMNRQHRRLPRYDREGGKGRHHQVTDGHVG